MSEYWFVAPYLMLGIVALIMLPFVRRNQEAEYEKYREQRTQRKLEATEEGYTGRLCSMCGSREFRKYTTKHAMGLPHTHIVCRECGY